MRGGGGSQAGRHQLVHNALDGPGLFDIDAAPNDDQCGLLDVGAHSVDQRKPFAPNDNQCAPDESVVVRRSEISAVPLQWLPVLSAASMHAAAVAEDRQSDRPALSLNSSSHARRLRVSCPPGYYDSTNGNAAHWGCGCDNNISVRLTRKLRRRLLHRWVV